MNDEISHYPLLTMETLSVWERKVDLEQPSLDDLKLLDHYMTSIHENDIKEEFAKEAVYSLEEYLYVLKDRSYPGKLRAAALTGHLLGCIHMLQDLVKDGDKIY